MAQQKVTLRDIARKLDVSAVTVSKALAGKEGVSEELRRRIVQTARQMGYRVRQSARPGAANNRVAILIAEYCVQNGRGFYWSIYQDIVKSLRARGYYAMLELVRKEDEISGTLPMFVRDDQVDGVFVLGWLGRTYLNNLALSGLPILCVDFYFEAENCAAVITDLIYDTYKITEYLYGQGHQEIGFVGDIHRSSAVQDQYLGYLKCMIRRGLPVRPEWVIPDQRGEDGRSAGCRLQLPQRLPTAFVCHDDEAAAVLVKELQSRGIRVPENVSVVGYYDTEQALDCTPELTTVHVDRRRIAEAAVIAGCNLMWKTGQVMDMTMISGHIVVRKSTKSLTK